MNEFANLEVDRLRQENRMLKGKIDPLEFSCKEYLKAAEHYQDENKRLRQALEAISSGEPHSEFDIGGESCSCLEKFAREALKGQRR